jgi:Transcriptional regulator
MKEKHSGDRRVIRTRQMLREALFALIEERGYDALTIQDITERANIGRATFYVHYQDKEQLLLTSVKELLDDLRMRCQPLSAVDVLVTQQSLSVILFQHVSEHASLYRAILSERGAALIITRLRTEMAVHIQQLVLNQLIAVATVSLPVDMLAEYCAASLWSLVGWWLRHDFPLPAEAMGQLYWQLINHGLSSTLGIPE